MRILWFTYTPSLAAAKLNEDSTVGGWIASLEKQISTLKDIELGVSFPHAYNSPQTFSIGNTTYFTFPFMKDKGKITGLWDRWSHSIEPADEINFYLQIIEQYKPDLIHIFGSERSFGNIINHIKIPVVLQIQGNLSVCSMKYFSGVSSFETLIYSNKKSFLLGYNIWHQFFTFRNRAIREQQLMKNCKFIIGRTDWDRYISKILAPESIYFHCDEVLRDKFYCNQWSLPQNKKFIIFSTLSATTYKGFETILLTSKLLKTNTAIDFEWYIAGPEGTEEIITVIEKSRKHNFKDNNVFFKGLLDVDELINGLLISNCYVHPSHIENSSNSVCEAMILGVPVIATFAGGTPSLISNGVEGLLVQDGDPYALAGAIMEFVEYPEKSRLFSENARQKALFRHKPSTVQRDTFNIYKTILNK